MSPRVVAGTASKSLADAIAARLGVAPAPAVVERFPDGELRPAVDDVRGDDVYMVQATGPPVNEHLIELLLLLDACHRAHAAWVTAVIPYFGYARQDRRTRPGQAVAARVVADAIATAGADQVVLVDPHTTALEAMIPVPVETLTAVPALADALAPIVSADAVLVAPDLGGVKLADAYAAILDRPVAVVRKTRVSGTAVQATELVGDVGGRPVIIVDDMISTGATIEAAADLLLVHDALPDITVAATHGLLVGDAPERLGRLPLRALLVTDSVTPAAGATIAPLLADAIARLHCGRAVGEVLAPACPCRRCEPRGGSPGRWMVAERLGGELDHTAGGDRLGARPLDEPELEGDEHRPLEARDVIWWCGTRDQRRGQWPLGTQPSGPRGADVEVSLTITLATGASGGEESVTIARPSPCAACDGSGALPGTTPGPCQARGGSGQRVTSSQQGNVVIKHVSACAA